MTEQLRPQLEVERIFELSLDLICVIGFDGRFSAVNPAFEETLGYPPDQMVGRSFEDFVHPADREVTRARFGDVVDGREVIHFENRYISRDGSERWLEWNARAVSEQQVVYATARDATERRLFHAEQAALRRVATLVAYQASQEEIVSNIAEGCAHLFGAPASMMFRYDGDEMVIVASRGRFKETFPRGSRNPLGGENIATIMLRTKKPARIDDYRAASGSIGEAAVASGFRSALGAPIIVNNELWGGLIIGVTAEPLPAEPLPAETEGRLAEFTELMATAIANAEAREAIERLADEQAASRIRLITAADDARRRVVRDLHDGAQQRLVHSIITLKLAQRALRGTEGEAEGLVDEALDQAEKGKLELRELAHGILPSVLARGGLRAGVEAIVSRLDLPVDVEVTAERFPAEIEASAYFIVAEALTNVVKHARATQAEVSARVKDAALHFEVRDDGVGGADPTGRGLIGLADRATALGGQLEVQRLGNGGTLVAAALPVQRA